MPRDRPYRFRPRGAVLLAGLLVYGLVGLMRYIPGAVEVIYSDGIGPLLTRSLSRLSGLAPFAVWELVALGYILWRLSTAGVAGLDVWKRRRGVANAAGGAAGILARDTGIVMILFYGLWGFNYSRPPLETRLEWPDWATPDTAQLRGWAEALADETNLAYRAIHDTSDTGRPTVPPEDLDPLRDALAVGWTHTAAALDLPRAMTARYGRVKFLASGALFARLGIAGMFMPLTAEANVRRDLPLLSLPVSMAHEQAHQRGISSEAEAGFFGYVVAAQSPDPYARYAALAYGLQRMLLSLRRLDRDAAAGVAEQILPGVRRDYRYQAEYFAQFRGMGTTVGRAVNDRYLRANRIRDGVANYGQAERLLISYALVRDGRIVPPAAP